jgi:glycosyltransferase involved in cell wall biosynthesis
MYLVDIGASTVRAAIQAILSRVPYVIDTGDLAFALARSVGTRSLPELVMVGLGEQLMLRQAAAVVVRGRRHMTYLPAGKPCVVVRDLPPKTARPGDGSERRRKLFLEPHQFVVGLVGTISRAPRLGVTYGWDLVEALTLAPPCVRALIVGDGDGLDELKARALRLGVMAQCSFTGRVSADVVHEYIAAMDVAVSTQTNDAVGAVRTTGKLPLYLASGCPVIASDVGEARDILGPYGWTVPYRGRVDMLYPGRLAAAIAQLAAEPHRATARRALAVEISRREFVRDDARHAVAALLSSVADGPDASRPMTATR